jgi:hypothetical protein
MVEIHKSLPAGEKETFAQAFKKLCGSLAKNQDERLDRLKAMPRRLPDPIRQPKATFIPRRKRALTDKEAADLQKKDEARRRRKTQIKAENQAQNDVQQEQDATVRSQYQEEVVKAYSQQLAQGEYSQFLFLRQAKDILQGL